MVAILANNPILLLFIVAALGYPLSKISIAGVSLGIAAVLFAGIAVGAIDPSLKLPDIIYQFGLVLFVYTIGLSNGRGFFQSFKRGGLSANLLALGLVVCGGLAILLAAVTARLSAPLAVGMFAGSLTNTPALAGALEALKGMVPASLSNAVLAQPVIGYSVTYPMGVVGVLLAIVLAQRIWHIDYADEARRLRSLGAATQHLATCTVRVTHAIATTQPALALAAAQGWDVSFGRYQHDRQIELVRPETTLVVGDLVSIIGESTVLDEVTAVLGETTPERLDLDRSHLDFRRISISNPHVAGRRLGDLDLAHRYGAVVTRLRRGDIEFVPHDTTILELGDRVRVVAPRDHLDALTHTLGDSFRALSEIDMLTFSLGLALGLLLGIVPLPLPGGVRITLGIAGGPLIVALILGAVERTGPLLWTIPYSANLTIRQFGLILFLAGVGTRAGYAFVSTAFSLQGLVIFLIGLGVTLGVVLLALTIGYKVLHIPMSLLIGIIAGIQTQPAVLGFALEQSGNEIPNIGYAEVYPIATIAKIIGAQLILTLLWHH